MKKFLTKLKPFVPAFIMLVIISISLIVVFSFDRKKDDYITKNITILFSIVGDVIIMVFYLLEVKFRKTILKWILFSVSIIFIIASCLMLCAALTFTTCNSLLIIIGIPFFNFFLFILSFILAHIFLKESKKEE